MVLLHWLATLIIMPKPMQCGRKYCLWSLFVISLHWETPHRLSTCVKYQLYSCIKSLHAMTDSGAFRSESGWKHTYCVVCYMQILSITNQAMKPPAHSNTRYHWIQLYSAQGKEVQVLIQPPLQRKQLRYSTAGPVSCLTSCGEFLQVHLTKATARTLLY